MQCEKCHHENKPGRRFCGQCGAALLVKCGQCGFENDPDDRFCGGCGQSLLADEPQTKAPLQEPDQKAERRQLTVLFCDLADSTELSTSLDPEDLNRLNRSYQEHCTRVIQENAGFVARYMGDGILAYFGYPLSNENDAENAVNAALALQEAVSSIPALESLDQSIAIRVGIATGDVVVGDVVGEGAARESTAVGKTPNLAARLQSVADRGEIVISDTTRALTGDLFQYEDMGELRLKGIDEPVRAFRVESRKQTESRFKAFAGVQYTPLVGRRHELALAMDCWADVCNGRGQVIMISGEPGIGKSRLTQMIQQNTKAKDIKVLQCSPNRQSSALYPISEYLSRHVSESHLDTQSQLAELLQETLSEDDEAEILLRSLLNPSARPLIQQQSSAQHRKHRLLQVLQQILTSSPSGQPQLLVIEDLHWIDPTTQELLSDLIPAIATKPVMILVTFRPEFQPPWIGLSHVQYLALNRVSDQQCLEMIRSLSGEVYSDQVAKKIIEKADGIPLFIEEITRSMMSENEGTAVDIENSIPETLSDSLNTRLDRLGSARRLARAGAVIGRVFDRETLQAITGETDKDLDADLGALLQSGLVYHFGGSGDPSYQFKHALIQDAAYNGLLREQRQGFHLAIAQHLEQQKPELVKSQPDLVAHHFRCGDDQAKAGHYFHIAGDLALDTFAVDEALTHYLAASEAAASGNRTSTQLHSLIGVGACYRFKEQYQQALDTLNEAETLAQELGDLELLADICHLRGNLCFPLGRLDDCLEQHQSSLAYSKQSGSLRKQTRAIGGLGDAYYLRGEMVTATEHFKQCCDMAMANEFFAEAAANRSMVGWSRLPNLEYREALTDANEAIDLCKNHGQQRGMMNAQALACDVSGEMMRLDEARIHAQSAFEVARKLGSVNFEAALCYFEARPHLLAENQEEFRDPLMHAIETSRKFGHGFHGAPIIGGLLLLTPDAQERRVWIEEAESILSGHCVGHSYYWYYRDAMDTALKFEDWSMLDYCHKSIDQLGKGFNPNWFKFYTDRANVLKAHRTNCLETEHLTIAQNLVQTGKQKGLLLSIAPLVEILENNRMNPDRQNREK